MCSSKQSAEQQKCKAQLFFFFFSNIDKPLQTVTFFILTVGFWLPYFLLETIGFGMEGQSDSVTPGELKTEPVCLAPKKGENRKGGLSLISKIFHVRLLTIYLSSSSPSDYLQQVSKAIMRI